MGTGVAGVRSERREERLMSAEPAVPVADVANRRRIAAEAVHRWVESKSPHPHEACWLSTFTLSEVDDRGPAGGASADDDAGNRGRAE